MAVTWGPNMSAVIKWGTEQGILRGDMAPPEAGKVLDKALGTKVVGERHPAEKAGEIWLAAIRDQAKTEA
jgi:hypothetical protein